MIRIVLASNSPSRKKLMDGLGISYEIIPAHIDEKAIRNKDLRVQAEKIARAKAEFVAKNNEGVIIGADTFGSVDGKVLEKPKNLEEAKEMLRLQSDKEGIMYTGFCYIDRGHGIDFSTVSEVKYAFRYLTDEEIDSFVSNNPVLTWSAAFAPIDPYQMGFIREIKGSLTGLVYGLPAEFLVPCLEKSGVKLFSK